MPTFSQRYLPRTRICGPKYSLCCGIICAWGIFQLTIMGAMYYTNTVNLSEDLPCLEHFNPDADAHPVVGGKPIDPHDHVGKFYSQMDKEYESIAYGCWGVVVVYVVSGVICVHQFYLNMHPMQ